MLCDSDLSLHLTMFRSKFYWQIRLILCLEKERKHRKRRIIRLFVCIQIQTVYSIDYLLFLRKNIKFFFETMNQENNPPLNDLDDEKLSFVTFRKKVCFIHLFLFISIHYLSLSVG